MSILFLISWKEAKRVLPGSETIPTFLTCPEVFLIMSTKESGLVDLKGLPALPLHNFCFFLHAVCRAGQAKEGSQPLGLGLTAAGSSALPLVSFLLDLSTDFGHPLATPASANPKSQDYHTQGSHLD